MASVRNQTKKDELYLSGYWGAPELPPAIKQGAFSEDAHGGPSEWILGPRPTDDFINGLLWSVPYRGMRYAFVINLYGPDDALIDTPVFAELCKAGVVPAELVRGWEGENVFIYQSDAMLPNFVPYSGEWNSMNFDELWASIDCIDLENDEYDGFDGPDPVDLDPPSEDDDD